MNNEKKNGNLGEKNSCSDMLVVPAECVVVLGGSKDLAVELNVVQVCRVLCSLVKPSRSP